MVDNSENPEGGGYDCFISYRSMDRGLAERVRERLIHGGIAADRIWLDTARLRPGCRWHDEIEAGCESSRVVLAVLTPRWQSEWTCYETFGAESVIPLLFEGNFLEVAPAPLRRFQSQLLDLSGGEDAAVWSGLCDAIRERVARPRPERAARTANLRFRPIENFVGREMELLQIHEEFFANPTTALTQGRVKALTALGGVGKTTLARQYAEKFWRGYRQMFWVDGSRDMAGEFARIHGLLHPGQPREEAGVAQLAARALEELSSPEERLLIIDNAEDEEAVQAWIPTHGGCRTLITSRFAGWSAGVRTVHLFVLAPEPARELLLSHAGRSVFHPDPAEAAACDELASMLDYLPLALEQAAAYVREQGRGYTFADHVRLYKESTLDLLAEKALGSTEYPDAVATTWSTTVRKLPPLARCILRLSAFLAPNGIPVSMFRESIDELRRRAEALSRETGERTGAVPAGGSAEFQIRGALKSLSRYSMIKMTGQTFDVHRLVQTVERAAIPAGAELEWADCIPFLLHRVTPLDDGTHDGSGDADVGGRASYFDVEDHIAVAAAHRYGPGAEAVLSDLLLGLGTHYQTTCVTERGEPLLRQALSIDERLFGPNDRRVARALVVLANFLVFFDSWLLASLSDPPRSEKMLGESEAALRRAIDIYRQHGGDDTAADARTLYELARCGFCDDPQDFYQRILRIEAPLDFWFVQLVLARAAAEFQGCEQPQEADRCYLQFRQRIKLAREGKLSCDGPYDFEVDQALSDAGRIEEQEALYRLLLERAKKRDGKDSPATAYPLLLLGELLEKSERWPELESVCRRIEKTCEGCPPPSRVQSPDDHDPFREWALAHLALSLEKTGRIDEAEVWYRRAMAIVENGPDPEATEVPKCFGDYASLLARTGRRDEARRVAKRGLAVYDRRWVSEDSDAYAELLALAKFDAGRPNDTILTLVKG